MQSGALGPMLFLKLGGSLITEKSRPHTARPDVLKRLAEEIAGARKVDPALRLLVGHGSGSFGHIPARKYHTRQGVRTTEEWRGFMEVWYEAAALNRIVVDALHAAGLPAISFPPSASVDARLGQVTRWELGPVQAALAADLIPVVFGDVVFDQELGGTILSTEDLFSYLAPRLSPARILLAGLEPGVWADFPSCTRLVQEITPRTFSEYRETLGGSVDPDVTGGMAEKVRQALAWVDQIPQVEVLIFTGDTPGTLFHNLSGDRVGTAIRKT